MSNIISSSTTILEALARLESLSDGQLTLFVVDSDNRVRETDVSGRAVNSSYIVTDGVDAGDRIVTNPNSKLKNNAKVD